MKSVRWVVCVLVRRVLAAFHEWLADDGGGASRSARVHEVPFRFELNPCDLAKSGYSHREFSQSTKPQIALTCANRKLTG
ncbi:hypothetical protein [Mobiluncus mulieris]|uniref:hypothetical protein n=1 Tax=Mobiluncus mulieris TaxID=2052 RepID=UPI001E35860A|nr:hypothetical protein [Mobiluncus mulieris]